MPIIGSNFKTNHTRKSTSLFVEKLNEYLKSNEALDEIYIFPTSTSLDSFELNHKLFIGAQNAYHTKNGSFTGEIGLEQLEEFNKNLGFKIIYCIGEPLEVKKAGLEKTLEYIFEQFIGIDTSYENLILAYEPVWAIGTGITATNKDIKQVHNAIKSKINKPLLYGGSVKVENVKEICEIENVDGALIGTASWKIEDFIKILENTKDIR